MNNLNEEVFKNIQISSQENIIIKSFEKFYENKQNINLLIEIINSKSKISIRLIDYFVTKYSKQYKINYKINENNEDYIFNAYISYKQQLKAFQKKYFDPFGRGERIPFFANNDCVITTIGQLNFYRWFFTKKIFDYCLNNYTVIQNELLLNKNVKKRCKSFNKKRVTSLKKQINYIKIECSNDNDDIVVSFDF
jgi:hypothetical protein